MIWVEVMLNRRDLGGWHNIFYFWGLGSYNNLICVCGGWGGVNKVPPCDTQIFFPGTTLKQNTEICKYVILLEYESNINTWEQSYHQHNWWESSTIITHDITALHWWENNTIAHITALQLVWK